MVNRIEAAAVTPERLRRIEDLYHAARLDGAVLAKADSELRRAVESLLDQDSPGGDLLERPAAEVAANLIEHSNTSQLTARELLGRYSIEALLGEGLEGRLLLREREPASHPIESWSLCAVSIGLS
jgi:hypothetical protein